MFYEFSVRVKGLYDKLNSINELHCYRYFFFVKNSSFGTECRYAKLSEKMFVQEKEKEKVAAVLTAIKDECDVLLRQLETL